MGSYRLRYGARRLIAARFEWSGSSGVECELLDRRRFATPTQARIAVFDFLEGWYNPHRRHSALDYESPLSYEIKHRSPAA